MSKGGLTIHRADILHPSTVSNTTAEMERGEQTALEQKARTEEGRSLTEEPFLGSERDFGDPRSPRCGVGRGKGGEEGRGREDQVSPQSPSLPNTLGKTSGSHPQNTHLRTPWTPEDTPTHLPNTDPKTGDPHPPRTKRGRKRGGKYTSPFKIRWGRTPRPPANTQALKVLGGKDRKGGGARSFCDPTKSIERVLLNSMVGFPHP